MNSLSSALNLLFSAFCSKLIAVHEEVEVLALRKKMAMETSHSLVGAMLRKCLALQQKKTKQGKVPRNDRLCDFASQTHITACRDKADRHIERRALLGGLVSPWAVTSSSIDTL